MTTASDFRRCPEFDCCECGQHLVMIAGEVPEPPLCGLCQFVPGWFGDAAARALLDPQGHARPVDLSAAPSWPGVTP